MTALPSCLIRDDATRGYMCGECLFMRVPDGYLVLLLDGTLLHAGDVYGVWRENEHTGPVYEPRIGGAANRARAAKLLDPIVVTGPNIWPLRHT